MLWTRRYFMKQAGTLLATATASGCNSNFRDKVESFFTEKQPEPMAFDYLLDFSAGSGVTRESAEVTLRRMITYASDRPSSRIQLWVMGQDVTATLLLATKSVEEFSASTRLRNDQKEKFVATTSEAFLNLLDAVFKGRRPTRSPLIESISKIARVDGNVKSHRVIVCHTDGREYSRLFDLECSAQLEFSQLEKVLALERLLKSGTLKNATVYIVGMDVRPVQNNRCRVRVADTLQLETLWTKILNQAGADVKLFAIPDALIFTEERGDE